MTTQLDLWDNPLGIEQKSSSNDMDSDIIKDNYTSYTGDLLDQDKENMDRDKPLSEEEAIVIDQKRVVNGIEDINQLAPFRYNWAWDFLLKANDNHWLPQEISMQNDKKDYTYKLLEEEKHVYTNVLSYLSTADILAMRNIGLAVMEKMTAPEIQAYQGRQVYEEVVHTMTYQHCIESLGLDQYEVYNRYRVVPEIHEKIKISNRRLKYALQSDLDLKNKDNLYQFVLSYLFFAAIFEGLWFYNGFTPIFSLQRRGLMKDTGEQFQYIMRDEALHYAFGLKVIKTILEEEHIRLDHKDVKDMIEECYEAESAYIHYILQNPIFGYSIEDHLGQYRFLANRRMRLIGLPEIYPDEPNHIPWLDEQTNIKKEKNFFETRVMEYKSAAALVW